MGSSYTVADLEYFLGSGWSKLSSRTTHNRYSVLEVFRQNLGLYGTASGRINPEHRLMILLIIELESAPHKNSEGPNIQDAYLPIVRDLVSENLQMSIIAHEV